MVSVYFELKQVHFILQDWENYCTFHIYHLSKHLEAKSPLRNYSCVLKFNSLFLDAFNNRVWYLLSTSSYNFDFIIKTRQQFSRIQILRLSRFSAMFCLVTMMMMTILTSSLHKIKLKGRISSELQVRQSATKMFRYRKLVSGSLQVFIKAES